MRTRGLLMLILAALLVTACGDEADDLVTGSFVAETSDPQTFVALVVGVPADGGELLVYVCDGQGGAIWFEGPREGDRFTLTSDSGAEVSGSLAGNGATGTIRLADGTTLAFAATRADGIAGLYEVESTDDRYQGSSYDGDRIEAVIGGVDTGGTRRLDVTFTSDDGPTQTLAYATPSAMAATRWIILADGRLKGIDTHPTTVVADDLRP